MMTKQDFELIARSLLKVRRDCLEELNHDGAYAVRLVAQQLALKLSANNPRFDRTRFLLACGVTSN